MPWVISGECNRCGSCCKDVERNSGYCEYARLKDDGLWYCIDRTESNLLYWNSCRVWPDTPNATAEHPHCSYAFEWVDDPKVA